MALMKILYIPDPRLRVKTKPVTDFGDELQKIIEDMFETMHDANGVGLAATQVGLDMHISVIDATRDKSDPIVICNAEVIEAKDFTEMDEGCLSVPGHYDKVTRAQWVKIKAQDRHGNWFEREADGVLAEAFQHEIDHLNGKLYIDQLSSLKQKRIRGKVEKFKRREKN